MVDEIDAFSVRAARRRLTLVCLELTIGARVAQVALAPVAGRFGVIEFVVYEQIERGRRGAVRVKLERGQRGHWRQGGRGRVLEASYERVLVRVLPALAVNARRGLAFVDVDLAVLALVASLTCASKLVYSVHAARVVEALHANTIVNVHLTVATCIPSFATIAFVPIQSKSSKYLIDKRWIYMFQLSAFSDEIS